jgi:polyhydroxybutyrate depolymerase
VRAFTFERRSREFLIQPVSARGRHPVVILLHGGDSDARKAWTETSLPTLGRRDGFIVVAPNALENRHWNDGRGTVGEGAASTANDVGFLEAVIAEVIARFHGDANVVFMAGISNGGMMTMRFACEKGELLRAAATVIADLPEAVATGCRRGKPLPWLAINAERDPRIPFEGSAASARINGKPQAELESADRTFAFFADRAGCSHEMKTVQIPDRERDDHSWAEERVRSQCIGGTTSTQYVLFGSGHNVPGLEAGAARLREYGAANEDVDAGSAIWAHFAQTLRTSS